MTHCLALAWRTLRHKRLRSFNKLIQAWLTIVSRLAGMNNRNLAEFGRFDEFFERAGIGVFDVGLLVFIIGKHAIVSVGALVTSGATWRIDVSIVLDYRCNFIHDDGVDLGLSNSDRCSIDADTVIEIN